MSSFSALSARASTLGLLAAALPVGLFGAASKAASTTSNTLCAVLLAVISASTSPVPTRSTVDSLLERRCVLGHFAVGFDDDDDRLIRRIGPAGLHYAAITSAWLRFWAWGGLRMSC